MSSDPRLGPILRRGNLKDAVAAHIRELILSGELRPGSKIDQDAAAFQLGVSKLPVREALIALESEGLVRNVARRGAFVASLEREDLRDHYRLWGLVAGIATEHATEKLTDMDLDDLEGILRRMDETTDPEIQERLNFEFHRRINRAGGSGRLLAVLRTLAKSLPSGFFGFAVGWAPIARQHHWEIMEHLRARDADSARDAVARHLRAGGDHAVRMLEERGFWPDA